MSDAPTTTDASVAPATIVEPVEPATEEAVESKSSDATAPVAAADAAAPVVDSAVETTDQATAAASNAAAPHGKLGYKSGFMGYFLKKKKYFWLGDEPVSHEKLSSYLRGEKPEVAHPTAAWSTQTGKGLLYYAKDETKKTSPDGVMNLAEISDLKKEGTAAISFTLYKHKQTLECTSIKERDAWFTSLEKESEAAKASKEHITSSDTFKETIAHLEKPAGALAVGGAAVASRSKSAEPKPTEIVAKDTASESSEKKKTPTKDKSRSVSRKRHSIFGGLLGKKEDQEEAAVSREEAAVAAPATDGTVEPVAVPAESAPADATEVTKPATEAAAEKPKAPRSTSKSGKRSSVFGLFGKKDAGPAEETATATTDAPVESSTAEAASAPAVAPEEIAIATTTDVPVAEQVKEAEPVKEEVTETTAETATTATETTEKRKSSFFGLMKEKAPAAVTTATPASEEQKPKSSIPSKLGGLFRSSSKAGKATKEAKEASPPPTVVESSEAPPSIPAPVEQKPLDESTTAPAAIGDVVPDAVSTGNPEHAPQAVSAAA